MISPPRRVFRVVHFFVAAFPTAGGGYRRSPLLRDFDASHGKGGFAGRTTQIEIEDSRNADGHDSSKDHFIEHRALRRLDRIKDQKGQDHNGENSEGHHFPAYIQPRPQRSDLSGAPHVDRRLAALVANDLFPVDVALHFDFVPAGWTA